MLNINNINIAVIGLGYVGLPLAVEFGKKYPTTGFDINQARIDELNRGEDSTLEVEPEELKKVPQLTFSAESEALKKCNFFIVTVPTPIDKYKRPDLSPLIGASKMLATVIKQDDIIVFESTVYPGATEDDCIPVIEEISGLTFNKNFYAGYSPERINPGDKQHRLTTIKKVTSGSTPEIADIVDTVYASIIEAGTHKASSIKVAEAAKVIENTQRDLNIALINELALIFNKMGIDTLEVLEAAGTKWNFLPFRPGLVGGHCIGVDPYYLTHKAQEIGYHPEVILAGRRINDSMGPYVADCVIKLLIEQRKLIADAKILVLGLTFKENCPDLRNTRVVDIVDALDQFHCRIDVHDPWVDADAAQHEYGIELVSEPKNDDYDAIILAVPHQQFIDMGIERIRALGKKDAIVYDVKSIFPVDTVDARL